MYKIALIGCSVLLSLYGPVASAVEFSFGAPEQKSNRQKAHLNVAFTGGSTGQATTCDPSATYLEGENNVEAAFRYFVKKGLTEKQSAGIVGNLSWESKGINPRVNQDGGGPGQGIAQWSVNERWVELKNWAEDRDIYDLATQLDYVWYEMNSVSPWSATLPALKATTDISSATKVVMDLYEKPGEPHFDKRLALANAAYGDYATGQPSSSPSSTTTDAGCGGSGSIVAIAQAELKKGVKEDPIGCDAGNPSRSGDCGPEVNKYTDNTLEYWCADFVSWVYKQAGTPFTGGASGGWRIASVEGVEAYMKQSGRFYKNSASSPAPRPGDVYVINGGVHIGIVVKVEGNKLYAISGNTSVESYSNGVGVGSAVYDDYRSDASITGWGGL